MKNLVYLLIGLLFFVSCKKEIGTLSDLKSNFYALKETPARLGDELGVKFDANEDKIDSVILILNGKNVPNNVKLDLSNVNLGINKLQMKVFIGNDFIWGETEIPVLNSEEETPIDFEVVKEFPHNSELFTQGFLYHNNKIYESGGRYKQSKLVTYTLGSTNYLQEKKQIDQVFSEGIALLNNKIYQLTYKERQIFVYDANTLELIETLQMPDAVREGWGMTSNGKELLISDGSHKIYFFDEKLNLKKQIQVVGYLSIYTHINEMEYINDKIYANVWTTNFILVINPNTGAVEQYYDLTSLSETKDSDDVLNGIASYGNNILVTGKNWSKIYELANK